ncbi:hypothetical protein PCANC_23457 [Puccinia coronata f. sp. avenae]|uniref:Uncharacterized protein n=1 Tax=Puccinia coronata f. sp. avenae TaxID=200324 RepID=A0A2N5UL95_9BASI|nr:hypothetical protein PCASD_21989 [Puccinia coronata f. sp. avenae]PLW38533.1 hypothetical protein PCANC_23457 [Puccinia coronata f. sp. avenae]
MSGGNPVKLVKDWLTPVYTSKASQSERSPSELCLQAASRLRTLERKNCSSAHRPLLNAFSIGSQ